MSRIRILPDALASRIAAGEVVERPASIVRELVENAIDAGAKRIEVELEDGGRRLVLVRDDGCGMDRDDALLAFQQHATSKLAADSDLSAIETCGFRGEALAAIASCSRVTLVTAVADGEGTRVRFEAGVQRDVSAVGAPRGTSVEVRDLFATIPARRKFLRSAATELAHAQRLLEQHALARPMIHFLLRQGRLLLDFPPARDAAARIAQVLGPEFAEAALAVDASAGDVRVRAWLVRSDYGTGRLAGTTLLVNGRPVSDRILAHAVRSAGTMLFGVDVAPAGIVLVDLPARDVDVNVHPAKREVRFARPGEVHDAVRDLLRGAVVSSGAFAPALDAGPRRLAADTLFGPSDDAAPRHGEIRPAGSPASRPSAAAAGWRVLGQHRNTYVIVEDGQGLLLVDQHCAHERILFERVLASMQAGGASQRLLEPAIVELPRSALPILLERAGDLALLGLEIEPFGEAVAVRAVPAAAGTADPAETLRELAAQEIPGGEPLERIRALAATIACKAAVKAGHPLGNERMKWLVDELFAADVPTTCPHGRVSVLRLSDRDIDHRFGRI